MTGRYCAECHDWTPTPWLLNGRHVCDDCEEKLSREEETE